MKKAILFTHIYMENKLRPYSPETAQVLIQSYKRTFKEYLKCRNVYMVYVFVDIGFRHVLNRLNVDGNISFHIDYLEFEFITRNCLKRAVDECKDDLREENNSNYDPANCPKFQFIGLPHLLAIIRTLYRIDSRLTQYLCGKAKDDTPVLTYDSPKFIEAIIRLVRGNNERFNNPILRVDSDVIVEQDAISKLIQEIEQYPSHQDYAFFSGQYGGKGHSIDPVNDFAVRITWLVNPTTQEIEGGWKTFLKDLNELGAFQIEDHDVPRSDAMAALLAKKQYQPASRQTAQVISGAGLYMTHNAIQQLPPFMNFNTMITWVDDHLKRRLHEIVEHISPTWLERVPEATFEQHRYVNGVTNIDIDNIKNSYFDRLFSGCIMHSLIQSPMLKQGPLGACVRELVFTRHLDKDLAKVRQEMTAVANEKALDVLSIWSDANYGNNILNRWAEEIKNTGRYSLLVDDIVNNSMNYIELVKQWPNFVFAIQKLTPVNAYWLFR